LLIDGRAGAMKQNPNQIALGDGSENRSSSVVRIAGGSDRFDEVWAAMVELFGPPMSPTRALRAKIVRELADSGATGAEVLRRASLLVEWFGDAKYLTETSLLKYWGRVDGAVSGVTVDAVRSHESDARYSRLLEETP
jgi:hypothetical protein